MYPTPSPGHSHAPVYTMYLEATYQHCQQMPAPSLVSLPFPSKFLNHVPMPPAISLSRRRPRPTFSYPRARVAPRCLPVLSEAGSGICWAWTVLRGGCRLAMQPPRQTSEVFAHTSDE